VSPAILQLAQITDFNLFITTTGDRLLEQALAFSRPGHSVVTPSPAFSKERPTDLPASGLFARESVVYHLFGQYSGGARSFVMTEEDLLDYVVSLQTRDSSLGRLSDVLRTHRLLILSGGYHDWLARFILRTARPKLVDAEDILAEELCQDHESLRLFLKRFSPKTAMISDGGARFVEELFRRWQQQKSMGDSHIPAAVPPPPPVMPARSVFISYASQNRDHARLLREKLRGMGVEAWFDVEQLEAGDNWDQKIRRNVNHCTLFLPIISTDTEKRVEGYFRREWKAAAQRTEAIADGMPFILPLVVDPALRQDSVQHVPREFQNRQWGHFSVQDGIPQAYLESVASSHQKWLSQSPSS
jgi:hypothetical protein